MKFRPEADVNRPMTEDELKALAQDIDEKGQLDPIALYEGDILDGRSRYRAITEYCEKVKEPRYETVSPKSPIAFVESRNDRRHDTDDQRAMAAARAEKFHKKEAEGRGTEGKKKGGKTAGRGRSKIAGGPVGPPAIKHRAIDDAAQAYRVPSRTARRAKFVQTKGSQELQRAVDYAELSLGKAEQIIKQSKDKNQQNAKLASVRKSRMVTRVKGLTGQIEWYTPRPYLDAAIAVMGDIDLDPASSDAAQRHVKAKEFYTLEVDGLKQEWQGRVFLNPPYRMPTVSHFAERITEAFEKGDITEGILLTNNATDTEWFHRALAVCSACCLTQGRISFLEARDGEILQKNQPTHGQAFFYFGRKVAKFAKVFSQYGAVIVLREKARGRCPK